MTGVALLTAAVVIVLVLGTYVLQALAIALVVAAHVVGLVLNTIVWCGWFVAQPHEAMEALRAGIAAAEAESAIRRLNGVG